MNKKSWTFLFVLGLLLAVFVFWKNRTGSIGLTPQNLEQANPYEALARGTGGQVMTFNKEDVGTLEKVLSNAADETDYALLWTAEGMPAKDEIQFEFVVDSSVSKLSVFVSALSDLPVIQVLDPQNQVTTPETVSNSKTSAHLGFSKPQAGKWQIKIKAHSNMSVQVKAEAALRMGEPRFVRRAGRLGHEGYFPYEGPLKPKDKEVVAFSFSGIQNIRKGRVKLISLAGQVLDEAEVDQEATEVHAKVRIPSESFRVAFTGLNPEAPFLRVSSKIFQLGRNQMVEFKTERPEALDSDVCKTLTQSSHWSMLSNATSHAMFNLNCVEHHEASGVKKSSHFNFFVPVHSQGQNLKTKLVSADYQKLTQQECETAEKLFARYPRELFSGQGHRLTWSFQCEGEASGFIGVMEVSTSAVGP